MEKEYVFHGSPIRVDKLIPNQACDIEYKEGCQYAVYATTNKIMAILFSMGCIEEGDNAKRIMMPEYGDKMCFYNCHPNYNGKGYLYYLDKSKFIHAMGSQWVCYEEIVPEFVEEIEVNDYLAYCIIEKQMSPIEREKSMSNIYINARSSIRIEGTKVIYFDPFKITEEAHDADVIFVTHEHYDHFSPEDIKKVANENTVLVAPFSMEQMVLEDIAKVVGEVKFVNAEDAGTDLVIEDILIKWARAYNIDKPFHTKERDWVGYIVTLDGETYFVTGDSDANEDNSGVMCDVLFVPCGGKYTFDAKEAAEFTGKIKPRKVIPTHYTDMPGESEIGEIFKQAVQKLMPDVEVEVML